MIRTEAIGNLTRDPESRVVPSTGDSVVNFTVAASTGYGTKKHTEFIRVSAWGSLGENCAKFLRKGSKVWVSGIPGVNVYSAKDGAPAGNLELRLTEIEFLSAKPADLPVDNVVPLNSPMVDDDVDVEDLL